ncbi:MAG: formate/nitrite transporter family protein [Candidatus Electrothrix sp. YB6]
MNDEEKRKIIDSVYFTKIPFFHGLKKVHLDRLKPRIAVEHYAAGDILFCEGDPGDCLYIVVSGKVRVFVEKERIGITQEVARLSRNESFGEMALLSGALRSASVKALSDLTVLKLCKEEFDQMIRQNKYLAIHFSGLLSKRLAAAKHEIYEPKLSAKEVHASMTRSGVGKSLTKAWHLFFLAVLAGIYISLGGHAFLVALEQGMGKIVAGAVFGIGLILVVIAEAELFTGNIIMMVGLLSSRYHFKKVLENLLIVYTGNFVGAICFTLLMFKTGLFTAGTEPNSIGQLAIRISEVKMSLSLTECITRGFFCNMLVILAIIMSVFAKDIISKIFCCILPVMVFVASGFEHCVANMYLIPIGFIAKGVPLRELYTIFENIFPVTLGNIAGGLFIIFIHPIRVERVLRNVIEKYPSLYRLNYFAYNRKKK